MINNYFLQNETFPYETIDENDTVLIHFRLFSYIINVEYICTATCRDIFTPSATATAQFQHALQVCAHVFLITIYQIGESFYELNCS